MYLRRDTIEIGINDDILQRIILETDRALPLQPRKEKKEIHLE